MEADPRFLIKLAVECGLQLAIILLVNALASRSPRPSELEFVLRQVQLFSPGYDPFFQAGVCLRPEV